MCDLKLVVNSLKAGLELVLSSLKVVGLRLVLSSLKKLTENQTLLLMKRLAKHRYPLILISRSNFLGLV